MCRFRHQKLDVDMSPSFPRVLNSSLRSHCCPQSDQRIYICICSGQLGFFEVEGMQRDFLAFTHLLKIQQRFGYHPLSWLLRQVFGSMGWGSMEGVNPKSKIRAAKELISITHLQYFSPQKPILPQVQKPDLASARTVSFSVTTEEATGEAEGQTNGWLFLALRTHLIKKIQRWSAQVIKQIHTSRFI